MQVLIPSTVHKTKSKSVFGFEPLEAPIFDKGSWHSERTTLHQHDSTAQVSASETVNANAQGETPILLVRMPPARLLMAMLRV